MKTSSRRFSSSYSEDVFKRSWSRRIYSPSSYVFRRRLQHVLIKTNIIVLVIRLQDVLPRSLQNVFKMSSRRLAKTSSRHLQDVFKTSSKPVQDVFKTYHQVKLFLLTRFQNYFETYSKRF